MREKVIAYSLKYEGDWTKISQAIKNNEPVQPQYSENCFTIFDEVYPQEFRELRFPPWVVYYHGNLELLKRKKIGIIGSRKACEYGLQMTEKIVESLSNEIVTVSGLAKGIDAKCHSASIASKKGTIGILGCGIDRIYPLENKELFEIMKKEQLILSEYPNQTSPYRHHFPWRNRLIAALSEKLVVTQAEYRSGTMHTVNEALALSKSVYCVPYNLLQPQGTGCNELIYNGAFILTHLNDLT